MTLGDDGVMFAKNSDRDPNEAQILEWVPPADHAAGSRVSCTWIDLLQAPRTNALLISRPWWMWGAEIGTNEHRVVIDNEAIFTTPASEDKALLGMDLVRLALERAASARWGAASGGPTQGGSDERTVSISRSSSSSVL